MSANLEALAALHSEDDGCPKSPAFRRELIILIRREQAKMRFVNLKLLRSRRETAE